MTTIKVEGMVCQVCANSVTRTLSDVKGVKNPVVDLEKGEVNFEEEGPIDPNDLKSAVEGAGWSELCRRVPLHRTLLKLWRRFGVLYDYSGG
jgi:copper chaperone